MKKIILCVSLILLTAAANNAGAWEKAGWTMSLPGYNMGTSYSCYQPQLGVFMRDEIDSFLGLDPVANRMTIWNPAFVVRYSVTPNLQVGLHFNGQQDQWTSSVTTNPDSVTTRIDRSIASLTSYLPTAVLLYRIPVAKGYFSIGGGLGYYVVKYSAGKDNITVVENPGGSNTTTFGQGFGVDAWAGNFGTQALLEFTYPVFRDVFFFSVRAGYVFCLIPQPAAVVDNEKGYNYYVPDIDLGGLLATVGFTAEF